MAGAACRGGAGLGRRGGGEVRGGEEQHPGDVPQRAQGQVRVRHRQLRGAAVRGHLARMGRVPQVQPEGVPELRPVRHLVQAQEGWGTTHLRPCRPRR